MILFYLTNLAYGSEEAAAEFTIAHMWAESGFIAKSVIIMLALMFLGALVVSIDRMIAFRRATQQSMDFGIKVGKLMANGDIDGSLKVCNDEDYKSSYIMALVASGLKELDQRRDAFGIKNAGRALSKTFTEEVSKLKKGMSILATTGSTAPFVGLFGTTFGVINAFQGMSGGDAGLAGISAGISEALITTGVGIGVAVMGVWFFNYFNHRIEKISDELTSAEAEFMDWAEKLVNQKADS